MAGGGGGGEGEPEFQVAPMIDMLLVLLIFFMSITSTQVLRLDREITLPVAPNASKKKDSRDEIIVNLQWDAKAERGLFSCEGVDYAAADDLLPILQSWRRSAPNPEAFRVVIRGDEACHALFIGQVMNAAAQAGISDIVFSALNQ